MARPLAAFGLFACLGLLGCSQQKTPPKPSDPATGREVLQKALAAWKAGESLEAFRRANPDVNVVDRAWQSGAKLLDFSIDEKTSMNGYDVRFTVQLSLQDPAGRKSAEKATYIVSTSPALVVVHSEAPDG
jgi:hypothetical protein